MWARALTGASAGTGSRRSSSARWSGCGSASKLGLRDIPEVMAARGVEVSHETVRERCDKFGAAYAKENRRRRPRPGDKWPLDEIVVKMNGPCCVVQGWGRRKLLIAGSISRREPVQ